MAFSLVPEGKGFIDDLLLFFALTPNFDKTLVKVHLESKSDSDLLSRIRIQALATGLMESFCNLKTHLKHEYLISGLSLPSIQPFHSS